MDGTMPKQTAPKRGTSRKGGTKPAIDPAATPEPASAPRLVIAIPKGRVLGPLAKRLAPLGVNRDVLLADDRTLVRDDPTTQLRFLLLKPDDVPTYVEYGSADL